MKRTEMALSLTYARRDIPWESFGFIGRNFCDDCKGFDGDIPWHTTSRASRWEPEDGYHYCPSCGSDEVGKNQQDHGMKVVRRYSIHRNPNYKGAA